ncbi:hypothetical protein CDD81_5652 [Ophiocordyceps australis]|uniref:Uncharacterized protein n=1 Tax=Ophiocordyceps australis TaxID=1399860 RepID=A0A2C5Y9W1_9HYPO|nr:hypothetical protein CDD81_5652 [Ophiocordyceps australis]
MLTNRLFATAVCCSNLLANDASQPSHSANIATRLSSPAIAPQDLAKRRPPIYALPTSLLAHHLVPVTPLDSLQTSSLSVFIATHPRASRCQSSDTSFSYGVSSPAAASNADTPDAVSMPSTVANAPRHHHQALDSFQGWVALYNL